MSEKRFQGEIGSDYDIIKLAWPYYEDLREFTLDTKKKLFSRFGEDKINTIELGYGTGDLTFLLLQNEERIKILGIDSEESMFEKAKLRLKNYISEGRLSLVYADGLDYLKKLESNSFDLFASAWCLNNIKKDKRKEILREIFRVIKKGALFINADKYALQNSVSDEEKFKEQMKKLNIFDQLNKTQLKEELIKHDKTKATII